jgi:hypothetical protein
MLTRFLVFGATLSVVAVTILVIAAMLNLSIGFSIGYHSMEKWTAVSVPENVSRYLLLNEKGFLLARRLGTFGLPRTETEKLPRIPGEQHWFLNMWANASSNSRSTIPNSPQDVTVGMRKEHFVFVHRGAVDATDALYFSNQWTVPALLLPLLILVLERIYVWRKRRVQETPFADLNRLPQPELSGQAVGDYAGGVSIGAKKLRRILVLISLLISLLILLWHKSF